MRPRSMTIRWGKKKKKTDWLIDLTLFLNGEDISTKADDDDDEEEEEEEEIIHGLYGGTG